MEQCERPMQPMAIELVELSNDDEDEEDAIDTQEEEGRNADEGGGGSDLSGSEGTGSGSNDSALAPPSELSMGTSLSHATTRDSGGRKLYYALLLLYYLPSSSSFVRNLFLTVQAGCLQSESDSRQSSSGLPDDLKHSLECPICSHIPLPPIMQCRNGHITCNVCRAKVRTTCTLQQRHDWWRFYNIHISDSFELFPSGSELPSVQGGGRGCAQHVCRKGRVLHDGALRVWTVRMQGGAALRGEGGGEEGRFFSCTY